MVDKCYNKKVVETFPKLLRVKGEVGIEIEIEGSNLPKAGDPGGIWLYHDDHSLRGEDNAEYVLRTPLPRGDVAFALKTLFNYLQDNKSTFRKNSPTTSVHVHVNVQTWTIKQVYNFICCWYIFEELLVEWCGEHRVGNVFCLRGQDAENVLFRLANAVRYARLNDLTNHNGLRYAALNATALSKFGSLEFRSLAGVYDPKIINTWVDMLLSLKDFANNFESPPDILAHFSKVSAEKFLQETFPDHYKELSHKNLNGVLHEGMRLIQGVAFCVNWEKGSEKKSEEKSEEDIRREEDEARLDRFEGRPDVDWQDLAVAPPIPRRNEVRQVRIRLAEPVPQIREAWVDRMRVMAARENVFRDAVGLGQAALRVQQEPEDPEIERIIDRDIEDNN